LTTTAMEKTMKTSFTIEGPWVQFFSGDNPYHEAKTACQSRCHYTFIHVFACGCTAALICGFGDR
jgi:hypothetical protein